MPGAMIYSGIMASFPSRTKHDIHPLETNVDPKLHPLEAPREYKRAVNAGKCPSSVPCLTPAKAVIIAVKLERMFAKPFIGALDGKLNNAV